MSSKPFSDVEIIEAVGIKLKEMRTEAREATEKLRAELKAEMEREVARLRAELLADRLDQERGIKRRSSALPDPVGVNRAH